jgi:large subunit ribosomal protein L14
MILINSTMDVADNAGAIKFKCIRITGGFARRYAKLGDVVGSVSQTRRKYDAALEKKKRMKKVRKKRKIKAKKRREPSLRPYLTLIVSTKKAKRRGDGSSVKFDTNRVLTFTDPTKFGPAGKTENIPNFIGSRVFGPICREAFNTPKLRKQFKLVVLKSGGNLI